MGSVVSSAANGVGTFVGNALGAPFRALFGASCEGVCSGTFDLPCFIEHLCFSSLARLVAVLAVTYVVLFFGYLLCKLGIVKCVAKNAFKMVWKPCSACCRALGGACCHLWRKVRDTKRVYRGRRRGRRRDVELGDLSTSRSSYDTGSSSFDDDYDGDDRRGGVTTAGRSRGKSSSVREKRKERIRQSLRLKRVNSKVEHAARVSQGSGRRHRHSTGPRGTEVPSAMSSLRVHGFGSAARDHSRVHRRT